MLKIQKAVQDHAKDQRLDDMIQTPKENQLLRDEMILKNFKKEKALHM